MDEAEETQAELERLREENRRLKLAAEQAPPPARPTRQRWRAWVSTICLVLAAILAATSIAGAWARTQLVNEDAFVSTFAPLADDPDVQDFLIDQTTAAIFNAVDVDKMTEEVFSGLSSLDMPPKAKTALEMLKGPAAQGVRSMVTSTVASTVRSDAFPAVWRTALVASHRALVAAATMDESGSFTLNSSGELGVNLKPIVEEIKKRLSDQGFGLANSIPSVDRVVVIAKADSLLLIGTIYVIADNVGTFLPWLTLGLLIAGVLIARRRSIGALGAGLALAIGAGALAAGIVGGGQVLQAAASGWGVPPATMNAIFEAVSGAMRDTAVALTALGVIVAVTGWLSSRSRAATRVRGVASSLVDSGRNALQNHGLNTGSVGVWLYRQRILVGVILLVAVFGYLFASRPLSLGEVFGAVLIGLLAWLIVSLLQRKPSSEAANAPSSDVDEATGESADTETQEEVSAGASTPPTV